MGNYPYYLCGDFAPNQLRFQEIRIEVLIKTQSYYIWMKLLNGPKDILFISQNGQVYDLQCPNHLKSLILRHYGLGLMLDIDIFSHDYHQLIPQFL